MKIAILHPSNEGSSSPFASLEPECNPARYLPDHLCTHFYIDKAKAVRQVVAMAAEGFDVAVNLCDGAWDEDRPGIEVVRTLEELNVAFTGAGSLFYDPSREAMKMACHSAGVKFPLYTMARTQVDYRRALERLQFPMIVKHPRGYASAGMTKDSRVADEAGLRRETDRMIHEYGAALIEEFVEGREFTALVAEARGADEDAWVLEPVEFRFPAGETFKHFDLKWKDYAEMRAQPVAESGLADRLRAVAALTFAALGGSGFGRCDLRVDDTGEIYLLEINPNCGMFYPEGEFGSADFILAADPAGHRGFLLHLIECALRRRDRGVRVWRMEFTPERGFGLYAAQPLQAGDVVVRYEERAQRLVSKRYAERHWRGLHRDWFDRYAWPLAGDVYGIWSEDPGDWRPINHGCDPNTWLDGLDLVARRNIAEGEHLTVDYATFCGPGMKSFPCVCGAGICRNVICGTDCFLPEIAERYGERVSPFVRAARDNHSAGVMPGPVEPLR